MHNHEPPNYYCPFCAIVQGVESPKVYTKQADIVWRGEHVIAFMASHGWANNQGHVLVASNAHYENLYDLPDEIGSEVQKLTKRVAIAMREVYGCDGIATRQHNEPDGQDVWHYHQHIFPRYLGDLLYERINERVLMEPDERRQFAARLRAYLSTEGLKV